MVDEKFHFSNGEILIKETFLIFFFLDERTSYSKTNRKKTEVNIMSFTFCECVLMPSGIRSAVVVTTIIQLDLFFLKLKFSYVVLNKDHRLPTVLWWALSQYGYHVWNTARPSLSPQGLEYLFFHRKVPQPRVNTWQQHRSCQSDSLVRGKHCCNTLEIFPI